MTWFEALDECRYQGEGSELLVIESPSEGEWILQMISKINYTDDPNDRVWHVNAHRHLYNSEYSAWANGRSLGIPTVRTTQSWNCTAGGVLPRAVENECLGLDVKENADLILVYLSCTSEYTSRAICKRPNPPIERSNTVSSVFNPAEWVPSPRNERLFYRIMKVESESQGKLTWYLARLLCMKYEAELSDIEDNTDFEWLNALITSNKKKRTPFRKHRLLCEYPPLPIWHARVDVGWTAERKSIFYSKLC